MERPRYAYMLGIITFLLALTASASGHAQSVMDKAKQEGEVIVWTQSFDNSDDFLKGFYAKYPFLKVKIWDGRSEEVINKVVTEAAAGKFSPDVLLLSTRAFPAIHKAGLLQEYKWPARIKDWPHQPAHGYWRIQAASIRIPAYNTNMVKAADVPKSWDDINSAKWRGKAVISSSGADAALLFADLWKKPNGDLNWEKATTFWKEVIDKTKPKVIRGFSGGFDAVASGESAIFLVSSTNSGLNFIKKGAPINFASVGRTVASPWGIGVPKTLPHPNASQLFLDYLLSEEGLLSYLEAVNGMTVDPVVGKKAFGNNAMQKAGVEWYPVDDETRSDEDIRKATRWWTTALGVRKGKK